MVNCANCDEKIGIFQKKYGYIDEKGRPIKYCSKCNADFEKKEDKKRLKVMMPILEKYFETCSQIKKVTASAIYTNKDILEIFKKNDFDFVSNHFNQFADNLEDALDNGDYDDLDETMNTQQTCKLTIEFLDDLEKLSKLFRKKEIETNYVEIIRLLHELTKEIVDKETEQDSTLEYKRISHKLKKDISVRSVTKEFIKSPLNPDITPETLMPVLDKFKLDYDESELEDLIDELTEEIDLDDFEENLGNSEKKLKIPDYESLNGHQFESFLKTIFESLGYVVVQTKLSGDQGADLILMKNNVKTVVQSKKYTGNVSNKAIQEVVASKKHYKSENAIVVTTGEFTKGAIQLAISNDVELWDKNKLDTIIKGINSSSKKDIKSSQESQLDNNSFLVDCLICGFKFNIDLDKMPEKGETRDYKCPDCNSSLSMNMDDKYYACVGCKHKFDSMKERVSHEKNCKEVVKRRFNCKFCKKRFIFDDSEMQGLKTNGQINIVCPACKKNQKVQR